VAGLTVALFAGGSSYLHPDLSKLDQEGFTQLRRVPQATVKELKSNKIIGIRHAESKSNLISYKYGVFAERLYPGIIDAELTDEGIKQCIAQ
jgi:hypothetical protein